MTNKRVVFLGHGQPAGQVAGLVLAACALGSGSGSVLQGFTDRAFPYTNLTNLENLEKVYVPSLFLLVPLFQLISELLRRPGFIAGVCNPAFADRPSWWDVLCNIETGKIVVSKDIRPASPLARSFPVPALNDDGAGGPGGKMDGKSDSPDNAFMDEVCPPSFTLHASQADPSSRSRARSNPTTAKPSSAPASPTTSNASCGSPRGTKKTS